VEAGPWEPRPRGDPPCGRSPGPWPRPLPIPVHPRLSSPRRPSPKATRLSPAESPESADSVPRRDFRSFRPFPTIGNPGTAPLAQPNHLLAQIGRGISDFPKTPKSENLGNQHCVAVRLGQHCEAVRDESRPALRSSATRTALRSSARRIPPSTVLRSEAVAARLLETTAICAICGAGRGLGRSLPNPEARNPNPGHIAASAAPLPRTCRFLPPRIRCPGATERAPRPKTPRAIAALSKITKSGRKRQQWIPRWASVSNLGSPSPQLSAFDSTTAG